MPCMLVLCTVRCACGLLCYILYFSDLYIRHAYTQRCYLLIVYFQICLVFIISSRFIHHNFCPRLSKEGDWFDMTLSAMYCDVCDSVRSQSTPSLGVPGMCVNLKLTGGPPLSTTTLMVQSKEGGGVTLSAMYCSVCDSVRYQFTPSMGVTLFGVVRKRGHTTHTPQYIFTPAQLRTRSL